MSGEQRGQGSVWDSGPPASPVCPGPRDSVLRLRSRFPASTLNSSKAIFSPMAITQIIPGCGDFTEEEPGRTYKQCKDDGLKEKCKWNT